MLNAMLKKIIICFALIHLTLQMDAQFFRGVGFFVGPTTSSHRYRNLNPIDNETFDTAALEFKVDPVTCALNGGEDYELLFTIKQADFEKVKNHADIQFIGYVHEDPKQNFMQSKLGTIVPLTAQGWDHFK